MDMYYLKTKWIVFLLSLCLMLIKDVVSIKCLQCASLMSPKCVTGSLPGRECDKKFQYCIKYVGILKRGVLTFRDCHKTALAPDCGLREVAGQLTKVCITTCDTDDCNGGPSVCTGNSDSCAAWNGTALAMSGSSGSILHFMYTPYMVIISMFVSIVIIKKF